MKKAVLIFIILCFVQSVFAQEAPLTQAEYVKMLYSLQKDPGGKAAIVEALRNRGIAFVLTDGLRGLTRSKGANDDDLKRALEEAERRRQNPVSAKLPSVADGEQILEKTRANTLAALQDMPDFVVKELVSRYVAYAGTGNWKPLDTLAIAVSFSTEKGEQYRVLAVNGARVDAERGSNYHGVEGATTSGEFVNQLEKIFSPDSKTAFKVIEMDVIRGRRAAVFQYQINVENNKRGGITFDNRISTPAGQLGKIWIDLEAFRVLRIEYALTDIEPNFPVRALHSFTDYDWVTIADEKYLLPMQSDARFTALVGKVLEQTRNVIRFRNYQKYGSDVKILDEDIKPEAEPVKPD